MHEEPWIIAKIIHPKHQTELFQKNASTSELRDAISTLKNGTRYFSNVFSELDKEKQKHPTICTSRIVENVKRSARLSLARTEHL